jgi:hypothetical protein
MILFADSFDHYGTGATGRNNMLNGAYGIVDPNVSPETTTARTGDTSLRFVPNGNRQWATRPLQAAEVALGIACGLYLVDLPNANNTVGIAIGNSNFAANIDGSRAGRVCHFTVQTDGSIAIYQFGTNAVLLGQTDPGVITAESWNHIQFYVEVSDTVGYIELRVNGAAEFAASDLNLGTDPATQIVLGVQLNTALSTVFYFDDLVPWDTSGDVNKGTSIGPVRVVTTFPGGDWSPFDWSVGGAATGAEAVDDPSPDGDATYIEAADVGNAAQFTMPTLPEDVEGILGVHVVHMGKQTSAGLTSVKTSLISEGEEAEGPEVPYTTAYTYRGHTFEFDPATAGFWTRESLEAALLRIERTI